MPYKRKAIKHKLKTDPDSCMRIGFGLDIHPYRRGRKLVLGGVKIPFKKGLQGHSDADALIHAVMDALIGAAGLGDIGMHFPAGDPALKGISSVRLLERTRELLKKKKFKIQNLDVTLVIEAPKIAGYIDEMRAVIAGALRLKKDRVNVKATRSEGLGFVGRTEGVAAYAVALLTQLYG